MKEQNYLDKLLELYPDKHVTGLSINYPSLYVQLHGVCEQSNLSIKEYLTSKGFTYSKLKKDYSLIDEKNKQRLLAFYPNKVVVGLRKKDVSFFQMLFATAKKRGMTQSQYIKHLGFDVRKVNMIDEISLKQRLLELYPDKKVEKLTSTNSSLYQAVCDYVSKNDKKVADFIAELGFEYIDTRYSEELRDLEKGLLKAYPDKVVRAFYKRHHSLYVKIFRLAKQENMTVAEYVNKMGFEYATTKKPMKTKVEKKLKEKLQQYYPDGTVISLSKQDANLYQQVKNMSHKHNLNISQYLKSIGFQYVGSRVVSKKKVEVI